MTKETAKPDEEPSLLDGKRNAPREMTNGLSAREAAKLWGIHSDGRPFFGERRRYDYSIT